MKTMAFECSAVSASCCIFEDGKILGSVYSNVKLTHSQTLLPMAENLLATTKLTLDDIDFFAVANGPGSFTGIRIGISAVKGLAAAKNKPCIPVSTLEAIAKPVQFFKGIVCAVMDARCAQVYNALFSSDGKNIKRLCDDRAIMISELKNDIENCGKNVIIIGDGAEIVYNELNLSNTQLAPSHLRYQNAVGVALASVDKQSVSPQELLPCYLRLPQAERELKKRNEETK